jgi:hypothetical protein
MKKKEVLCIGKAAKILNTYLLTKKKPQRIMTGA